VTILKSLVNFGGNPISSHEVVAQFKAKNVRVSPYKLRRIAKVLDKKTLPIAVALLRNLVTPSSLVFAKALRAVVSSNNAQYSTQNLYIRCVVDEGFVFKTHKPAGRGRLHRIRKRCSHVTLCLVGKAS